MTYTSQLTYVFTSVTEMSRLFSQEAVDVRTDDVDPIEEADELQDLYNELIDRATYRCKSILNKIFADADLYRHPWVREKATIVACYLLSIRRGNPSQYADQFYEAIEEMQALVDGDLVLEDLPRAGFAAIVMQNVHVDNRFPYSPIRVDIINSTKTVGTEFLQYFVPFAWL